MKIKWFDFQQLCNNSTDSVPPRPGIYLLWCKLSGGDNWRCYYVGEAANLQEALRLHLSVREPNPLLRRKISNCVTGYEFSVLPDAEIRAGTLKFLVGHFKPEVPAKLPDPDASPIDVNLP